jgi:magnesium chelatase accessory protein
MTPEAPRARFVVADGMRWHVQQAGSGPPLLLIHGTGASTHTWRRLMPLLAERYRVSAVDLPGHGRTDSARVGGSSIQGMSRGVAALLRELGVIPSAVVGHSAGAVILCRMALDGLIAPRVIIGINGAFLPLTGMAGVLFSPIARALASNSLLPRLLSWRAGNTANVARLIAGTGSQLDAEGVSLYADLVRDPRHVAGALNMMGQWDLRAFERDMPALTTPLAMLVAENDLTVPPRQALLVRQRLPNAQIHYLPGLGHLAHEEAPQGVSGKILAICRAFSVPEAAPAAPCDPPSAH